LIDEDRDKLIALFTGEGPDGDKVDLQDSQDSDMEESEDDA